MKLKIHFNPLFLFAFLSCSMQVCGKFNSCIKNLSLQKRKRFCFFFSLSFMKFFIHLAGKTFWNVNVGLQNW